MKAVFAVFLCFLVLQTVPVAAADIKVPAVPNAYSPVPGVVTAGSLDAADVAKIRDAGTRHVIDLTLDAETPDFDEAAAVHKADMHYSNLPVSGPMDLTDENVRAFDQLLRESDRPVLVHCSSGNRVGAMAALRAAWIGGKSVEEAIAIGKAWGLTRLEPEVRRRIKAADGSVKR